MNVAYLTAAMRRNGPAQLGAGGGIGGSWLVALPDGMGTPVRGAMTPMGSAWQPGALNLAYYPTVEVVENETELQNALNSVSRGTRIVLRNVGTKTYETAEGFYLTPKAGAGGILICSESISNGTFPKSGAGYNQRVTSADASSMARITVSGSGAASAFNGTGVTSAAGFADIRGYRFAGLDISEVGSASPSLLGLALNHGPYYYGTLANQPSDLVWDRCRLRSTNTTYTGAKSALWLYGRRNAAIGCSIENISKGGVESQGILIVAGSGEHYVDNTFIEALSINYFTSGDTISDGDMRPKNLIFRRSHSYKKPAWLTDRSEIKNHHELKLGDKVLTEACVFENHRAQAQNHAVVNYSVNQSVVGDASLHRVRDVTMRYIKAKNVGRIFSLIPGYAVTVPAGDYVYEHWLADGGDTGVRGMFLSPGHHGLIHLRNMTMIARTAGGVFADFDQFAFPITPLPEFRFQDIITDGALRSAYAGNLAALIANGELTTSQITNWLRANDTGGAVANTIQVADQAAIKYVDAAGGNYRLASDSPGKGAGVGGYDVGCDIDGLDALTEHCVDGQWA